MSQILNNIYYNTTFAMKLNSEELLKLQEKVTTGSRINRPSDDSSDAFRVMGLSSQKRNLKSSIDTIANCSDLLEISSTIIDQMSQTLSDTKTLLSSVTDTDGSIGEAIYANTIDNYIEELVSLANKKHNGQYLFGGSDTLSKPFEVTEVDGKITSVKYRGSTSERQIKLTDNTEITAFYVGSDLFNMDAPGDLNLVGDTGAEKGKGTSNVKGFTWMDVQQSAPGKFRFSIDDFDSYVEVDVPPGAENTKVTNSETGEFVYIDTRNVTSPGTELIENSGTHDVFNTLITMRDLFENNKNLSSAQQQQIRNKGTEVIGKVSKMFSRDSVILGSKINYLENMKQRLEDIKFNTDEETTRIQEADVAQIAIDLSRREVLYQMSLQTAGKIMSMSLYDFLR